MTDPVAHELAAAAAAWIVSHDDGEGPPRRVMTHIARACSARARERGVGSMNVDAEIARAVARMREEDRA